MEPGEIVDAEAAAAEAEPVPEQSDAETPQQMALEEAAAPQPEDESRLKGLIEAIIYVAEEPVTAAQIAAVAGEPEERVRAALGKLADDYGAPDRGVIVREVAGGYKMGTKPEHHEAIRAFAKSLKPPLKLSLAALETLAVIAYKQPITAPEIQEIRGVQGAGVLKTLLDRKLIGTAGRKNVLGKPILYKTTKEFLLQFGLKDLSELPTLKEFEDLRRLALNEGEGEAQPPAETSPAEAPAERPAEAAAAPGEPPAEVEAVSREPGSDAAPGEPAAEAEAAVDPEGAPEIPPEENG